MKTLPMTAEATERLTPPWVWLHRSLMPDYNRKATAYWWTVVLLGVAALVYSVLSVAMLPLAAVVQVLAGVAVALVAGFFPVRIGRSKSSFAAGEVFIFLLLLMHGPAAATLAAGCETMVGSLRTSKRWTSRIASPTLSALAMFCCGWLLQTMLLSLQHQGMTNAGLTVIAAMLFSLAYFIANTMLVATVPRLKRNERFSWSAFLAMFGWVGIAFAGSGAVAALLFVTYQQTGLGVVAAVVPIMAMLLATLHYYHRQQEANEAMRLAAEEAAAREAAGAARAAAREAEVAALHLQQLQESERRFHSAFTHASIGMALLSFEGRILQANDALRELLGVDDSGLLERDVRRFVVQADHPALEAQLARVVEPGFEDFSVEIRCLDAGKAELWVSLHGSIFTEPGSTAPCLILQAHDVTARRRAEAGLHHIAFHDALTGLPNRRRFGDVLAHAVEAARADSRQGFAVMFIDFDRFKLINDSLGHAAGDEFLTGAAQRVRESVRPGDVVARLGGDEFAVLLHRVEHEASVLTMAERMLAKLREPLVVAGSALTSSASIGITTSGIGYERPADVLRDADIAMYRAKAAGKDCYALFDAALHTEVTRRVQLEGDLRRAISEGELSLVYQPLYELRSARLIGFEALARWMHPQLGAIGPDVFIPIAEETGLIVQLTDFVLRTACRDLKQWQRSDPAYAGLTMNVNVSGKDLAHGGLVARITRALVAARLEPQHLIVELTENILMDQLKTALPLLEDLRTLGVGLSVDDFGTGYSSLAHLSSLPVDSLKIDRSFIRCMRSGSKEAAVVRAVVTLGHSLHKRVVAEGIETAQQYEQLRDMGCQAGQGYHLSRPLTALAVAALLDGALGALAPVALAPSAALVPSLGVANALH
jgi:diguanylate cyclase (GGDEF)-like protein/PAS domain S-box-containing protein